MKKRGDIQISFGMIFSVILIIAFIAAGFYGISKFLCYKKSAEAGILKDDLEREIQRARNGEETSMNFARSVSDIEAVCFYDSSKKAEGKDKNLEEQLIRRKNEMNMFFLPLKNCLFPEGIKLEHINIQNMTSERNPYCIYTKNNKISMRIEGYYGNDVLIS